MSLLKTIFPGKRITMPGAFLLLLAASVLLYWLPGARGLSTLAIFSATIVGLILLWRLVRYLVRTSIWRLRNRLIVTYIFIALVPILLILALVGIGGYIFAGQTATYLVSTELERTMGTLQLPARVLGFNPDAPHAPLLDQVAPFIRQRFPHFEVVIRRGEKILHYPAGSELAPADADAPNYTGLTVKDGVYFCWSHSRTADLTVDVAAPIEREMLAELVPRLGRVELTNFGMGEHARLISRRLTPEQLRDGDVDAVPAPSSQFDYEVAWASPMLMSRWGTGKRVDSEFLFIRTRPSALLAALFGDKFTLAQGLLFLFFGVAILFLLVEIVSAVIGISLTRTITGAIQSLYDGTCRVASGDFAHRIQVKGSDQLAEVSQSFNDMTERLERLIVVEKEKERLQSELEIAREVQNQLFPRSAPRLKTLEITGLCRPARMVSGDFYDFLCLQDTNLAIAIGDVAGKGISAALLMASIQSIMRTQMSSVTPMLAAVANGPPRYVYSTSPLVAQLNRQLYASTSPEKYATFLFAIYNEQQRTLTYTNAGHLPLILIRNGEPRTLEVTGTVVGAFPTPVYEEQTIALESGDLLVGYTDGITEPENEYGEEFGTERLVRELIKHQNLEAPEMVSRVMDAVRNWTVEPELPDDMTLVLARSTS